MFYSFLDGLGVVSDEGWPGWVSEDVRARIGKPMMAEAAGAELLPMAKGWIS